MAWEQFTDGPCKRCKKNPAVFYPTRICREYHALFGKIPGPEEIGYNERKAKVAEFFNGG